MPVLLVILLLLCLPLQLVAQVLPPVGGNPGSSVPPTGITCVDEVGIGLSPTGVLLCGPVLPAMAPALVAAGVDVNAIGQVIGTHLLTPLTLSQGGLGLTGGTPGGVLYFSGPTTLTSSALLPINAPLFGGGAGQPPVPGTLSGTTRQLASVLGTLVPQKQLTFDANGNVIASEFDIGTMGNMTLPLPVPQGGTGLDVGTPGGLLYFPTAATLASSPVMPLNMPLFGGGSGQPPVAGTRTGTTREVATAIGAHTTLKQLMFDVNGNIVASAADIGSPLPLPLLVSQGGTGLTSGAAGGLLYFPTTGTMASSPAMAVDAPLFGGGSGQAPFSGSRSGTTTQVATVSGAHTTLKQLMFDGSGNIVASASDIGTSGLSLPVPVAQGGTGLTSGTSGGLLYFPLPGTLASSPVLPSGAPLFGGGPGQAPVPGTRTGTTLEVATATGPHLTQKQLMFDTSGNIVASTFAVGSDLTIPVSVPQGGTGLTSGTPGGVLYFSAPSTLASTATLPLNAPLLGGGAGAGPVAGTRSGTTTEMASVTGAHTTLKQLMFDVSGNVVASTADIGGIDAVGAVSSVFGRVGTVTSQAGDYNAAQVTNAADRTLANVWPHTGGQSMPVLVLTGSISGSLALRAAPAGPPSVLIFPAGTMDLSVTGGPGHVMQQHTTGAPFTVGPLAFADLSGIATVCTITSVCTGYQAALGFTPENVTNKSNATLGLSPTLYPTQGAVKSYVDTGLQTKQATLGFTPENVANKSNATLDSSPALYPTNNAVKGYVDTGLQTKQATLGFTPENVANKSNVTLDSSSSLYPTNNAVKGYVDSGLATKQATLGFTPENVANKSNVTLDSSSSLYPTNNAVKGYVDSGLATKQATLGFTPENVANKSNATLDSSPALYPTNNAVKGYVDTGLQTKQATLGFTPENVANKSNATLDSSSSLYPTNNAVKGYVDSGLATKQATLVPPAANQAQVSTTTGVLAWVTLPGCPLAFNTTTHLFECAPSVNFAALTDGINTTATMTVGSGATLNATGTGQINATSVPGPGVTSPVSGAMIPSLNTLVTGLTPLRCVQTDASGFFVAATGLCGTGSGGGSTGASFSDITGGTNTTAAMIIAAGASLTAESGGFIQATQMPGEGLISPVPDEQIPDLNSLSTGLLPLRCVETDATGHFVSASTVCGASGSGGGTWGTIGGTLSNQFDLQGALDAKVPTARTVNGHALTSNIAVTAADVGLGAVDNTSDVQKNSNTVSVTNHEIVPRVQLMPVITGTPNHVTPNADNTDVAYNYTFTTALQVDTPTFTSTPKNQQLIAFELATAAPQTLTWTSGYSNECGLELPTRTTGVVSGQQVYNRFLYRYSLTSTKWCLIASTKVDSVRVTTLAPSNTYACPVDNSDQCEMASNLGPGTITVSDPGVGTNGQRLSMAFKCSSLMTINWTTAGVFLDSANYTLPTSCPLDTTKWLSADLRYSTVLTKWQLTRGVPAGTTVPATVVKTDQANTYGAFAQNFAAGSVILPSSAGASLTSAGAAQYDTIQQIPRFGENGMLTSSPVRLLHLSDAGNSNNGQTGDFLHTGATVTFPANYLLQHRSLRLCVLWRFTISGSPGTLTIKIRLVSPATDLQNVSVGTPGAGTNATTAVCSLMVVKDAPGPSASVYIAPLNPLGAFTGGYNNIAQPIGMATNGILTITMVSRWNTPVAGNIITPDLFTVEALN